MRRRQVLKLLGVGAALLAALGPGALLVRAGTVTASSGGRLYRGDAAGRIFVSEDGGSTWSLHTSFGAEYSINKLATDRRDRLQAIVGFGTRNFGLMLGPDRTSWYTT